MMVTPSHAVNAPTRPIIELDGEVIGVISLETIAELGLSVGRVLEPTTRERLELLGLLNDLEFARAFARSRLQGRGFGPRRVAAELARRGVARSLVDGVLAELGDACSDT